MRYIEGRDRHQRSFLPPALEDFVGAGAMVRGVDAFIGALDMAGLGFRRSRPARTGRPGYDPRDLLALYLYGYANDVRSSRRLEQECRRNVEVIWLLRQLTPDFKTIADFRKDNGPAFVAACRAFVAFCLEHELITTRSVVLDGSKLQAVASPKRILDRRRLEQEMARLDAEAATYLAALDAADAADAAAGEDASGDAGADAGEDAADPAAERARIEAALEALAKRRRRAAEKHETGTASGADKTVETEPEARSWARSPSPSGRPTTSRSSSIRGPA
jgi:transposase